MNRYILIVLAVMYLVGIIGHSIPYLLPLMLMLTPFTLLFTGSLTLYGSGLSLDKKFAGWFASTFFVTFLLEWLGVTTGMIFGEYRYSDVLGFAPGGVPLIIGFNWVLVIAGSIVLSSILTSHTSAVSLLSGVFALLFDLFLEPVAVTLNYWSWEGGRIPLQNYAAWFIIAAISAFFYMKTVKKTLPPIFAYYFLLQLIFFISLQLFL